MRIAKATLMSRWAGPRGLALGVFAILALLDFRLKALTGVGTADLAVLFQRGPVSRRLLCLGAGALCGARRLQSGLRLSVDAALCRQFLLFRHHRGGSFRAPARPATAHPS